MQFSTTLADAVLDAIGTTLGSGGTLKVYTGAAPGVGNAASGTLLSTLTSVTYAAASAGQKTISATADSSAAASGTPGYARLLTSGGTAHAELSAGVGTAGTVGTVTVSGGAIATVPLGSGGSGYPSGTYSLPCAIFGGGGSQALVLANIASGAIASFTIAKGGVNFATAPTVVPPPPFDLSFNATIALGGTVSLSSATLTQGNLV